MALVVCETFVSILGESSRAGLPAFFIRLTGCNLRCRWCDTPYSYDGGESREVGELLAAVRDSRLPRVLVTGGEPLLQPETPELLALLCDAGREVLLETNGSLPIGPVDRRVRRIVDVKCPGSGMAHAMYWPNLAQLTPRDEVKFVVSHREDFAYAEAIIREHGLAAGPTLLISPVFGEVDLAEAAGWVAASPLPLRLNLQWHKIIWGPERRGV
ncbi:MAG: radical SAM protein [Syntrophobacterales bacterium]|nr:radical SAM protein [Syntrophobacterales bacterium]